MNELYEMQRRRVDRVFRSVELCSSSGTEQKRAFNNHPKIMDQLRKYLVKLGWIYVEPQRYSVSCLLVK